MVNMPNNGKSENNNKAATSTHVHIKEMLLLMERKTNLKDIPQKRLSELESCGLLVPDDKTVMFLNSYDPLLLTERRLIIFKRKPIFGSRKSPAVIELSHVCSVVLTQQGFWINGILVNLNGLSSKIWVPFADILRETALLLWKAPRDGGITDTEYSELDIETEANKIYQKHVESFRKEWKKARSADYLLTCLDKISRKCGTLPKLKRPLTFERTEFWKSVIHLACAENTSVTFLVTVG